MNEIKREVFRFENTDPNDAQKSGWYFRPGVECLDGDGPFESKEQAERAAVEVPKMLATAEAPVSKPRAKRARPKSRVQRWGDAVANAQAAVAAARESVGEIEAAVEELKEIQQEYSDWKDNLPESLQQSATGEKLDAVCDLDLDCLSDIDSAFDAVETALGEAESIDLPLGWGKD